MDLAVCVRAMKDKTGEGMLLENGISKVETEMAQLGDFAFSGTAASLGVGVYEGNVCWLNVEMFLRLKKGEKGWWRASER